MTERRDDPEISRLERQLSQAKQELEEVKAHGEANEPLLTRLARQIEHNQFAARLLASLEQSRRST